MGNLVIDTGQKQVSTSIDMMLIWQCILRDLKGLGFGGVSSDLQIDYVGVLQSVIARSMLINYLVRYYRVVRETSIRLLPACTYPTR